MEMILHCLLHWLSGGCYSIITALVQFFIP